MGRRRRRRRKRGPPREKPPSSPTCQPPIPSSPPSSSLQKASGQPCTANHPQGSNQKSRTTQAFHTRRRVQTIRARSKSLTRVSTTRTIRAQITTSPWQGRSRRWSLRCTKPLPSRRGVEEEEGLALCHYYHQEWKELKDSPPSEPFRRGAER